MRSLRHRFNWKLISAIAVIGFRKLCFRLLGSLVEVPQIVELIKFLRATICRELLSICDGLQRHCSNLMCANVDGRRGRIELERLPPYSPELTPVESILGYFVHYAIPNLRGINFMNRADRVRRSIRSMHRGATLVAKF